MNITSTQKNTAILTLGNDPQIEMALNLACSLRSPKHGDFNGPVFMVSNSLSDLSLEKLHNNNITPIIIPENQWSPWAEKLTSHSHPFGKIAKLALIHAALDKLPSDIQYFVFLDPDIVCQNPLSGLLTHIDQVSVKFAKEPVDPHINPSFKRRLRRGCQITGSLDDLYQSYSFEINTGFFAASIKAGKTLLDKFVCWQLSETWHSFAQRQDANTIGWHDQDFFRFYYLIEKPANIDFVPKEAVFHLVDWANIRNQWNPNQAKIEVTETKFTPTLVHFAGAPEKSLDFQKYYSEQ